jgi:hypothetical protein
LMQLEELASVWGEPLSGAEPGWWKRPRTRAPLHVDLRSKYLADGPH